jgi:sulfotransferase family protein
MYSLKRLVKNALGTDIAGHTLAVRKADTFIVSYPRSGNTWTRFLIANLLHPEEPATFANIERLVPDAEAQSSRYMRHVSSPRIIKTHSYFDPRYSRVVYIVRDPRDIVLSYYHFSRKYRQIEDKYPLEQYVRDFVTGRLISSGWGTWGENVASWVYARGARPGFLLLRYEDMKVGTENELLRIAHFFDIELTPERSAEVIRRSSANRMRELERTQGKDWVSTKDKRGDIPFMRTATAGGWRSALAPEAIAEIEAAWGNIMAHLGYELLTRKADASEPVFAATAPEPRESRG